MIQEYYAIAPLIIDKINGEHDRHEIWTNIYETIIKAVILISEHRDEDAFHEYINMVNHLKERYLS